MSTCCLPAGEDDWRRRWEPYKGSVLMWPCWRDEGSPRHGGAICIGSESCVRTGRVKRGGMGSPGTEGLEELPGKRTAVGCRVGRGSVERAHCGSSHDRFFPSPRPWPGPMAAARLRRWRPETIQGHPGQKSWSLLRKRRGGTVNSRQAQKRTREAASTPEMALEAEPIELVESAGDEIVDLTCESLEPVVVDLTHNDSVVISITRGLLDLSENQLLALWILSLVSFFHSWLLLSLSLFCCLSNLLIFIISFPVNAFKIILFKLYPTNFVISILHSIQHIYQTCFLTLKHWGFSLFPLLLLLIL
ncbi:E3 ubiquitin-protein ligase RNF4 isoform X2 [Panthera leo]|uniref:E3 ubiquitin-protein ligase RNF4 isoform X2 n=1 Tax=Panthera leo TaxID=9689 RepID=UPI001C6964DE|nr:E3 ubiquitin-protein ligase RNF4 isoform X2 [Panthera leo]